MDELNILNSKCSSLVSKCGNGARCKTSDGLRLKLNRVMRLKKKK